MSLSLISIVNLLLFSIHAATIYNVTISHLSNITRYQAAIVQGLWNRQIRLKQQNNAIGTSDIIYLIGRTNDPQWLDTSIEYYKEMLPNSTIPNIINVSVDYIINMSINATIIKSKILWNSNEPYAIPTITMLCNEYNALPVTIDNINNYPKIPLIMNTTNIWSNQYKATLYSFNRYINTTKPPLILNKSLIAVQDPNNQLHGELVDFIISNNMFTLWMNDLCNQSNPENILYNKIILSPFYTINQTQSLSIMGYYQPNEVIALCSPSTYSQISVVSDYVMSLSYDQLLPTIMPYLPNKLSQIPYRKNMTYNANEIYMSIIQSDGDNIQLDKNGMRNAMIQRIGLCNDTNRSNNICPKVGWTISNRLLQFAPHVINWYYNISKTVTNVDSFLMGPSGYGYIHPSIMTQFQNELVKNTILNGYLCGEMMGYVHYDNYSQTTNMTTYLKKFDQYNYTSIDNGIINDTQWIFNGIFSPIKPYVNEYIGKDIVTFREAYRWKQGTSPQQVANHLNRNLSVGSLTYLYKKYNVDFNDLEIMVKLLNSDIHIVDYRELIGLSQSKRNQNL
eukprot:388905_1